MKTKNIILSLAIGDALGLPFEFMNENEAKKYNKGKMIDSIYNWNKSKGTWSDDTSLTLASLDSLIAKQKYDEKDIMNNFIKWYKFAKFTATNETFDVGNTTRIAIENYSETKNAKTCGQNFINNNGNGALMRITPISLYCIYKNYDLDTTEKIISSASALTHAHNISKMSCLMYTEILRNILNGNDKLLAIDKVRNIDYYKYFDNETINEFSDIFKGNYKSVGSNFYVVNTLKEVIDNILLNDNFRDTLIYSINKGGDTDTTTSITGALCGALYNDYDIPKEWLNNLINKDYIEDICYRFDCFIRSNQKY